MGGESIKTKTLTLFDGGEDGMLWSQPPSHTNETLRSNAFVCSAAALLNSAGGEQTFTIEESSLKVRLRAVRWRNSTLIFVAPRQCGNVYAMAAACVRREVDLMDRNMRIQGGGELFPEYNICGLQRIPCSLGLCNLGRLISVRVPWADNNI